jgi:hypothetical protein
MYAPSGLRTSNPEYSLACTIFSNETYKGRCSAVKSVGRSNGKRIVTPYSL